MGVPVLVHGAWQGAWVWKRVQAILSAAGHSGAAITLAGSGARAAELSPFLDLQTHVEDVVRGLDAADDDIVLVGHSYAGMALPGVVAARPDRVKALVFVDAFYPRKGETALDQMPELFQRAFRDRAAQEGGGWRLPVYDGLLDVWGLYGGEDRSWVWSQLTDWSLNFFDSPSQVEQDVISAVPRWVVHGTAEYPAGPPFAAIAERARNHGATIVGLNSGHDVMIEAPHALAEIVLRALAS